MINALVALVLAASAGSGIYFEQTTVTRADEGPAGPGVSSRVWYAGSKMRLEAGGAPGGHALILRLDTGRAYRLDPAAKLAVEIDLDRLRARSQQEASMVADLMGVSEEGTARVAELDGRTIAGHVCEGYRIAAGSTVMEVYVAPDVPVGVEAFADFLEWSGAGYSMGGILVELRKLRGFPMETRSRVTVLDRVHETVSTVSRVRVGPHPSGLFEPPAGYEVRKEAVPPVP